MPHVTLITGASQGIGAATARLLAQRGHALLIHCAHRADLAQAVAQECLELGAPQAIRQNTRLPWTEQIDQLSTPFQFSPGEALHIPFVAGHHVRNGPEDVSISMSIIFNTDESIRWRDALSFNHVLRKQLRRIGMQPNKVGQSAWRDAVKSSLWHRYVQARGFAE